MQLSAGIEPAALRGCDSGAAECFQKVFESGNIPRKKVRDEHVIDGDHHKYYEETMDSWRHVLFELYLKKWFLEFNLLVC
jgi:hypothetical protein